MLPEHVRNYRALHNFLVHTEPIFFRPRSNWTRRLLRASLILYKRLVRLPPDTPHLIYVVQRPNTFVTCVAS